MNKTLHTLSALPSCFRLLLLALLLKGLFFTSAFAQQDSTADNSNEEIADASDDAPLYNSDVTVTSKQSIKMWAAYTKWKHRVMLFLADEDPTDGSIRRLLKNEDAVDNAMDVFYTDSIAKKLSVLLYAHRAVVFRVKKAIGAADDSELAEAYKELQLSKTRVMDFVQEAGSLYAVAMAGK